MSNEIRIQRTPFGDDVETIRDDRDGTIYIVPRRISEMIGIDPWTQVKMLQDPDNSHWATSRVIPVPDARGCEQETCVIPLNSLPMWMCRISPSRVSPEAKEKLIWFQVKARDALSAAFVTDKDSDPLYLALMGAAKLRLELLEVQRQQLEMAHKAEVTEAKLQGQIDTIKAELVGYSGYTSLLGYCKKHKLHYPPAKVSGWSRKLGIYCTKNGIHWTKAHDPLYGEKSIFPEEVIDLTFEELSPKWA